MEFARQYVSALQDSRHVEKDRRETRRRLRNEYLTATLRHRDHLSRQALRRDIRMYTGMFSEMEQDLFTSIRRTSTWWNSLCEHSIDQRLQYEAAERDRRIHRAKYLGNMSEREAKELQNAVNSDGRRWLALKQESDVFERETRNAAIADAIQLILATTFDCVDALDKYSLQQSDEQSILTSFTLRNTTRQSIPTERINTNASDAFRAIFKGSPYEMSSPYFLELIHLMYRLMDDGRRVTTQFDASDVPLFVVDGPSYSGKSLLARNLAARFGMLYSSDHVLITKALSAYNREKNSFSDEVFSQAEILPALTTMEISSPRVKMHGGDVLTSGVLFANETNEEDKPGTMHLPSMWAILGKKIHAALVSGMAVEAALIGDLLRLELMDVQFGTDRRSGIIFDGVLVSLSLLQQLHRDLLPDLSHPFLDVGLLWCPSLVGAPLVDLAKAAEDEQRELEAMEAARRAEEERELEGGEPLVALEAPTSAGPAAATATPPAAEVPPTCCNQLVDIPPMWRITKSSLEDVPNKKEVKTKSTKRNNDAALLPPPDLPPVDAVMEDVVRERRFIARSQEELAAYHNVFAAALRIDCSPQEIFKRFAGLRMDRETGEEYHLIYDPPPRQRMPFLVNFDRTLAFTAQLHDMVFRQHTEWESLLRWFDSRPAERPQIRYIAGEATVEEMSNEAADVLNDSLQKFSVGKELHLASNAAINNVRLLMNKYRTQVAAREAERARLITLYTEKGVAPPPELEQSLNPNACCEIPDDLPDVVLRCVSSFSTNYASTFDRAWESCSDLTRLLLDYRMSAEGMLRHFWDRPDNKQELVDVFRKKFNHIPAHLRSKSVCKEELHYYVDELNDSLAASVESRKKDCLALIDHITRREAYLEGWEGNLANLGASMGCAEIERFLLVANMTLLYFSAVVGEPTMFEELDTGITPVKSTLESATVETSAAGKSKDAKDRRMQSAKKSHNKSTDDSADKSYMEEVINDTMQRLIASITAFTDKFKAVVDANIRGMKKNVMVNSVKVAVVAAKCLPVLESELGAAVERICAIKEFVLDVLHQAEAYVQQGKSKMLNEARAMLRAQASAVNSVVYSLRSCIEEEREAPHMHIGCGTFAVEEGRQGKRRSLPSEQSFLTDVPLYGRLTAAGVRIHSSLSATRLLDLIRIFRCLAPRYQLPRDDFMLVMRREDYAGALDEDDVEATLRVKEPSELFSSFDMDHTGVIDWREVIVHLLFWCNPPPKRDRTEESFYIPEVSIQQLTTTRDAAGLGLVTKEAFFNSPFFFDAIVDGDRLLAYTTALWETFCERDGCSIDMTSVLWFLCADPQPIRGAQKAFYVLSKGESRDGALTVEEMDCIFHIKATNARRVGLIDPFSKPNLQLLFGEASTITFAQVCASVIGRQMLNRVAVFRRKTFTTDL